jgi:hypothetical protein
MGSYSEGVIKACFIDLHKHYPDQANFWNYLDKIRFEAERWGDNEFGNLLLNFIRWLSEEVDQK